MADLDTEASKTYVYPTNYPIRDYQFNIVCASLLKNTLVCLPTGLGKTFIGAVLIYNYYRWYPNGKVVFLAPTRPLVAQQIEACFNVMGIPQEHTTEMTGTTSPEARKLIWKEKRVFFLTPQVLLNDLSREACPVQIVKLIVIDEAHKALGNHAVCQVMKQLRQQNYNFRVLALSATPGSDIQAIQQVVTNLMISHIEIRNEDSPDIVDYTHLRSIETVVIPIEGEIKRIMDQYLDIVKIYIFKLVNAHVLYARDETSICKFQLLKAREAFRQNPPSNCDSKLKGVLEGVFALCISMYHAYELLLMHGIRSFHNFLQASFLDEKKTNFYVKREVQKNEQFLALMNFLKDNYNNTTDDTDKTELTENQATSMNNDTISANTSMKNVGCTASHPKMEKLKEILLNHFKFYKEKNQSTRVMVFSQYRDSVMEITSMLKAFEPLIMPMSFIGQSSKGGKGISQKEQIRVIKQFRSGSYNTLISTCVGEEGLDIGEVDLIVCYDAPKSPIRLVQRMGRTGRKRDGRIVVLVTKGKEEQSYRQSQYKKKSLLTALTKGDRLTRFLYQNCPRMIPEGVEPVCLKLKMHVTTYEQQAKGKGKSQKKKIDSYLDSHIENKGNGSESKLLSEEEIYFYKVNYKVDPEDVILIQTPSFNDLEEKLKVKNMDDDVRRTVDLSVYQPWYTTLQASYDISHTKMSRNLVHLTEFINLQQTIGDNDNYTMEMAPFVDEKYFEANDLDTGQTKTKLGNTSKILKSKKKKKKINFNNNNNDKRETQPRKGIKSYFFDLKESTKDTDKILPKEIDTDKSVSKIVDKSVEFIGEDSNDVNDSQLIDFELPINPILNRSLLNNKKCDVINLDNIFKMFLSDQKSVLTVPKSVSSDKSILSVKKNLSFDPPPVYQSLQESLFLRPDFVFSVHSKMETLNKHIITDKLDRLLCSYNRSDIFIMKEYCNQFPEDDLGLPKRSVDISKLDRFKKTDQGKSNQLRCNVSTNDINDPTEEELPNFDITLDPVNIADKIHPNVNGPSIILCSPVHDIHKKRVGHIDNMPHKSQAEIKEFSTPVLKHTTNESVFLTPPKEETDKKSSASPFFQSRRPPWIEGSTSIYSSTPITDKSKKMFGNSSVNITPISVDANQKKLFTIVNQGSVNLQKQIIENRRTFPGPKVPDAAQTGTDDMDVDFDLGMNDDLFANIDMDEVNKQANLKYSTDKEKSSTDRESAMEGHVTKRLGSENQILENLGTENHSPLKIDKHCLMKPGTQLHSPNILTVTQVIDIINRPQESFDAGNFKSCVPPFKNRSQEIFLQDLHKDSALNNNKSIKDSSINNNNSFRTNFDSFKDSYSNIKNNSVKDSELFKKDSNMHLNSFQKDPFSKPRNKIVKNLSTEFSKEKFTNSFSNSSQSLGIQSDNDSSSSKHKNNNLATNEAKWIDCSLNEKKNLGYPKLTFNSNVNHFENKNNENEANLVQFDMGLDGFEDVICPSNKSIDLHKSQSKLLNESYDLFEDVDDEPSSTSKFNVGNMAPKSSNQQIKDSNMASTSKNHQIGNSIMPPKSYNHQIQSQISQSSNLCGSQISSSEIFEKKTSVDLLCDSSVVKQNNPVIRKDLPVVSPSKSLPSLNSSDSLKDSSDSPVFLQRNPKKIFKMDSPILSQNNPTTLSPFLSQNVFTKLSPVVYPTSNSKISPILSHNNITKISPILSQNNPTKISPLLSQKYPNKISPISSQNNPTKISPFSSPNNSSSCIFRPSQKNPTNEPILSQSPKDSTNEPILSQSLNNSIKPTCKVFPTLFSNKSPNQPRITPKISDDEESPIIMRKRNKMNALDSECDESLLLCSTSIPKKISRISKEKNIQLNMSSDEDFKISTDNAISKLRQKVVKKQKSKKKLPALLDVEAVVDDSMVRLSSDESESSLDNYDSSFVDDEEMTQTQHNVDMRAVYLQSVKSPPKKQLKIRRNAEEEHILDETLVHFEDEQDEDEDSFVVGNDEVEYDTEYMGDTMLAVDPIINKALLKQGSKNVGKKGNPKRRRIVELNSSSEEEINSPKKPRLSFVDNHPTEERIGSNFPEKTFETSASVVNVPEGYRNYLKGTKTKEVKNTFAGVSNESLKTTERVKSCEVDERKDLNSATDEDIATFALLPDDDFLIPSTMEGSKFRIQTPPKVQPSSSMMGNISPRIGSTRRFGTKSLSYSGTGAPKAPWKSTDEVSLSQKMFKSSAASDSSSSSLFPSKPNTTLGSCSKPAGASISDTTSKPGSLVFKDQYFNTSTNASTTSKQETLEYKIPHPCSSLSSSTSVYKNQPLHSRCQNVLENSNFAENEKVPGKQCILVDTSEVSMAGIISSTLRLKHGAQTLVLQVLPASYVISSRMAIFRQNFSAFTNSVNRGRLITRFRLLLNTYDRVVIIIEKDSKAGTNEMQRTFYLDTISCACAQLPQLKILYSCDQSETADLIWSLALRERLKENGLPFVPSNNERVDQAIKFYRSVPKVSASSAIFLALNFRSIKEAVSSNVEELKTKGHLSSAAATSFKAHFKRTFRKDLLNSSIKQNG